MHVTGLIIDPQNSFMGLSTGEPYSFTTPAGDIFTATLPVKGAVEDMNRLTNWILLNNKSINNLHVTLDTHNIIDVAHPKMWLDQDDCYPQPFTIITNTDIATKIWRPIDESYTERFLNYTAQLEEYGNYLLMIWPEHCVVGSPGNKVFAPLMQQFCDWEETTGGVVDWVVKGLNPFVEHYGAFEAEVVDPEDDSTKLNTKLLSSLRKSDFIFIAGEASSHCVVATVKQLITHIGDTHINKLHLLTDCMSPVSQTAGSPDFAARTDAYFKEFAQFGVNLVRSTDLIL